jgi:2-oxoglutarate ferredoxin oxidoreductase subunit alpha
MVPLLAISTLLLPEFQDLKQRQLFQNIVYVGALAHLINIDFDVLTGMVSAQYNGKDALIKPNIHALEIGRNYARDYLDSPLTVQLRRSSAVGDSIMIEGNTATALGCIYGGATVCAWYPITPSTSVAESFERYANRFRVDKATGKKRFAIMQAENLPPSVWSSARHGMVPARSPQRVVRAVADERVPRPCVLCRNSVRSDRRSTRETHPPACRHVPTSGLPVCGVCVARRHAARAFDSVFAEECFDFAAAALDRRSAANACHHDVDLELGMNGCYRTARVDDARRYDRGKCNRGRSGKDRTLWPVPDPDGDGIGYRTLPGAHPRRAASSRGTSRDSRAVRKHRRLHRQHGPSAQKWDGPWSRAQPEIHEGAHRRIRYHLLRHDKPMQDRWICWPKKAFISIHCGYAPSRLPIRFSSSSKITS